MLNVKNLFKSKTTSVRRLRNSGGTNRRHPHPFLETLESRLLLSALPTGNVDILNRTTIAGWAFDADDAAAAITVQITINGTTSTVTANGARPDLVAPFGSAYHGFSFTMPTLTPGNSTVSISAVSLSTGASKLLKSATLANPAPVGWLDVKSDTQIAGWAYDTDSSSPIQIRVDLNGATGTPITTNIARPDLASRTADTTAGFSITGSFAGKVVEVYAIDAPSGAATLLYTNNIRPTGWVDVNDAFSVQGWAVDPNNTAASINVQVNIDGSPLGSPVAATLSRPALASIYGSTNHGFFILIPGLNPGTHTITVYALDGQANSAAPVLLSSRTVKNSPPVGHVDLVNSSVIAGWALDPDTGPTATLVSVYVDDTLFTTVPANGHRPDLVKAYGSAFHGFSVDLSSLAPGSHSISVTAGDNRVSDESNVVIFDDFINNHQPRGYVDSIAENTIAGWAQDPDAGAASIAVDIYVDGSFSTTTTANITRNDLTASIGSPNHGFSVTLPSLTFGTHRIDVYAAESKGALSTLIAARTITNNRPIGYIDLLNTTTVAGWAYDPNTPTQSLDIKVFINGVQAATGTANITRNDLTASIGSPNHAYSITLPTLTPGKNQIDIYAVDINNNLISLLKSGTITV